MTTATPGSDPAVEAQWREVLYRNSYSDIRWCKEQAWKALEGTLLLLAAISGASLKLLAVPRYIFVAMIALSAGLAVVYLIDLHRSAKKSRDLAAQIIGQVESQASLPERRFDPDHLLYLCVRVVIVLASGLLAGLIVYA